MSLDKVVCKNLRGGVPEEERAPVADGGGGVELISVQALFSGGSVMISSVCASSGVY